MHIKDLREDFFLIIQLMAILFLSSYTFFSVCIRYTWIDTLNSLNKRIINTKHIGNNLFSIGFFK